MYFHAAFRALRLPAYHISDALYVHCLDDLKAYDSIRQRCASHDYKSCPRAH